MVTINDELVVLDRVSKDFRGFPALREISITMGRGEVLGYVGPNGAGKTTTIKSLVGLITDFGGSISIDGRRLPSSDTETRRLVGYLPQRVAFQDWRTVRGALETFGRLSGMGREELDSRLDEVIGMVGLAGSENRRISKLSGGNIQKVGIAQAMLHRPKLLVLDEPLAGLDPASRYNLKHLIRSIRDQGTTVFFSSHILSDVQDVADRICVVNQGTVLRTGTLEELKDSFSIPNTYQVRVYRRPDDASSPVGLPGVRGVRWVSPDTFMLDLDDGVEEHNPLLEDLIGMGYGIESFAPLMPNLDELYMRFVSTGGMA